MDVLFLQPVFPSEMQAFTRGLAQTGARVLGVGDTPESHLPPGLKRHLRAYLQVTSLLDEGDTIRRIEAWLGGRRPHRVETAWEPTTLLAARLRERWGLPGMGVETVMGFRDKKLMHERVAAAGLPAAPSHRVRSEAEAWEAAARLGYPVVLKPPAGAGGRDTHICRDARAFAEALAVTRHLPEAVVERFVEGDELTYEALTVDGVPVFESMCRYLPNVLDARKHAWISPIIFCVRDLDDPELALGRRLGRGALEALGMGSGMCHMEWFARGGDAIFGEMACRPPGAEMMTLMNHARGVDLYAAWGRAVVGLDPKLPRARPYAAAIVFKRAQGRGRIRAIRGLRPFLERYGAHVVQVDLLPVGAPRRDWRATFKGDGFLVVRHPDGAFTLQMAREAAATIHLLAG